MQPPLVTIYLPTKNRLESLKKAVQSVLAQTYTNWELIVVNDASTDGTKEYLDRLQTSNKRIRVFHQEKSQGACVARNKAIFEAKGEFITGLDDDDEFEKNRIVEFVECWHNKESDIAFLFSSYKAVNNGEIKYIAGKKEFVQKEDFIYGNPVNNQIFTRTEFLKKIGGFDEKMPMWQDLDCWVRMCSLGLGKCVDNQSYIFDITPTGSRISEQKNKLQKAYKKFVRKNKFSIIDSWLVLNHFKYYGAFNHSPVVRWKFKIASILKAKILNG